MRRHRTPRRGEGTAWLVLDRGNGDYLCYWYAGSNDARLVEQARVSSASDSVAWAALRTSRVRIRTADACTYWAGTAPRPEGITHTWNPAAPSDPFPQPSAAGPGLDRPQ